MAVRFFSGVLHPHLLGVCHLACSSASEDGNKLGRVPIYSAQQIWMSGVRLENNYWAISIQGRVKTQETSRLTSQPPWNGCNGRLNCLVLPSAAIPLELFSDVAWETYCPVNRLGEFVGLTVTTCGLVVEQRTHHQITGEPMKFLTLADWTGMVETELFASTYRNYALATVRYPVLEVEARVEPFDNGRGFWLRVLRAGKPRTHSSTCTSR